MLRPSDRATNDPLPSCFFSLLPPVCACFALRRVCVCSVCPLILAFSASSSSSSSSSASTLPLHSRTFAPPPTSLKGLRACLRCGLLKTFQSFYDVGCDNCPFLNLSDSSDLVSRCTSSSYVGSVAVLNPHDSWMARYVHIGAGALPGVYAVGVTGTFDREVLDILGERGVKWRCRPEGFVPDK